MVYDELRELARRELAREPRGHTLQPTALVHEVYLKLVPQDRTPVHDSKHFFALAAKHRLDIDCHIDETLDPSAMTLRHLARAAIRHGFAGRIVAGHCCSLSTQEPDEVRTTLDDVAMAGIAIVSLPMCNMYLQDRHAGRTPRRRGVTLAHEIRARGIPMVFASDNTRDPFYAFGDLDLVEVFREAVRIAHLDHPVGTWPAAISTVPSAVMNLDLGCIAEDGPADLIVLEGRSWSEVLSRPQAHRTVLRNGKAIDSRPPSYAELDDLLHGVQI